MPKISTTDFSAFGGASLLQLSKSGEFWVLSTPFLWNLAAHGNSTGVKSIEKEERVISLPCAS